MKTIRGSKTAQTAMTTPPSATHSGAPEHRAGLAGRAVLGLGIVCLAMLCAPSALSAAAHDHESATTNLPAVLQRFERYATNAMADWGIPGMAIAIVKDDRVVYLKGFGIRSLAYQQPVDPDTVFQIASISKSFTACLIACLVDQNKLRWDERVIEPYPQFRLHDPWVTREFRVTDLLAHRSGLPPCGGDLKALFLPTRDDVINTMRYIVPVSSFRSEFAYQNNFLLVAAKVAEIVTGGTWEQNVRRHILDPLDMGATVLTFDEFRARPNKTGLHCMVSNKVERLPDDWPYFHVVDTFGPAASVHASVRDMANYLRMHLACGTFDGRRVISKENMAYLHTPKTPFRQALYGARAYYTQGLVYEEYAPHAIVWHNGSSYGCRSMMAFSPDGQVGIVILSNLAGTDVPDALGFTLFDMLWGKQDRDLNRRLLEFAKQHDARAEAGLVPPAPPEPSLPPGLYAGQYTNPVCGTIHVAATTNGLIVKMGTVPTEMPLQHWQRDVFYIRPPNIDVSADGFLTFRVNDKGMPVGLALQSFTDNGIGEFVRKP